jgi:hypothetical protein
MRTFLDRRAFHFENNDPKICECNTGFSSINDALASRFLVARRNAKGSPGRRLSLGSGVEKSFCQPTLKSSENNNARWQVPLHVKSKFSSYG